MERFRSWLIRHRDQSSVSYSRFGKPADRDPEKPPPTSVIVASFNENSSDYMFFNYWHVQKAAASSACFGLSMTILFFVLTLIEFDWNNHGRGVDVSALLGLFLYLALGVLVHYYVLEGIKRQQPRWLIPFIAVYSCIISIELLWCLIFFFKSIEPHVRSETSTSHTFLFLFFIISCTVIVQTLMLETALKCRQYLSRKYDHEMELKVAEKDRTEYPGLQIIIAGSANANSSQSSNGNVTTAEP